MGSQQVRTHINALWNTFLTKRNISYLFINIGNIPIMALTGSFLAIYYVDVLGMDEYAVGTMFLVARIFDGINDPVIGGIIDRANGDRLLKFRRILVAGTLVCSLNHLILWLGPAVTDTAREMVAYISYLMLGITFPIMDISLNGMIPVLSRDSEDRDLLSSIKVIGYGIGTVLIEILVPLLLSFYGASRTSYIAIIVVFTLLVIILSVTGAVSLGSPSEHVSIVTDNKGNSVIKFIRVLKDRNVLTTFFSGICFYTGNAVLAVSNTYYASYYLGNVKFLAYMTVATYALEIFVIMLISKFSRQLGYKRLFTAGLITAGTGLLIRFFPYSNEWTSLIALFVSSAIFGIGYGFAVILFYSIQACNVERIYTTSGIHAEGMVASLMSMVNKIGKGIGGAIPLYILGIMKTSENVYSKLSLRIIDGLVPALLMIIGAIIFIVGFKNECL